MPGRTAPTRAALAMLAALAAAWAPGAQASPLVTNGDFTTPPVNGATPSTVSRQLNYFGYNLANWSVSAYSGSSPFLLWWLQGNTASNPTNTGATTQYGGTQELSPSTPWASAPSTAFVSLDADPSYTGYLTQKVTGLTVGTDYVIAFDYALTQMTTSSSPGSYYAQLYFNLNASSTPTLTGAGTTGCFYLGAAHAGCAAPSTVLTSGSWRSTPWASGPGGFVFEATSATEYLSFLALGGPSGGPPLVLLDDISLNAMPEPGSLALLGAAAALGLAWRRTRPRNTGNPPALPLR